MLDGKPPLVPLEVPHKFGPVPPVLSRLGVPVGNICSCSQPCPCSRMFSVDETTAAAIRQAYEASGELSAVVELRRHFPGITDNESARRCVRAIAGGGSLCHHCPPSEPIHAADHRCGGECLSPLLEILRRWNLKGVTAGIALLYRQFWVARVASHLPTCGIQRGARHNDAQPGCGIER
jgi:hypothetical protein